MSLSHTHAQEDLAPFGYELPASLTPFLDLLRSLGAQDEPGAQVPAWGGGRGGMEEGAWLQRL